MGTPGIDTAFIMWWPMGITLCAVIIALFIVRWL